jgi:uncharacterized protein (TIGR04255 family)
MNLPKKISPNPLISSTVEIRFQSSLTEEEVLSRFYSIYHSDFPAVKDGNQRDLKRVDPKQFEFSADYTFQNEEYSISVAKNLIAFENIGSYHLWSNYFEVIKKNLSLLIGSKIVDSFIRVGVRYASFFEGAGKANEILKNALEFRHAGFEESLRLHQVSLKREDVNLYVQIAPFASVQILNSDKTGMLIDIDASTMLGNRLFEEDLLFEKINSLHEEEKILFFGLLNEKFLKSLNPEY